MPPLSDDYIRSLEPESLRYDVTIFDDFVISVLPNGIRTWAFIYDYEGRKRRKTLGVYPDMSYAQAEDALDNAREMIAKLGDAINEEAVEAEAPSDSMPGDMQVRRKQEQRPAVLAGGLRKRGRRRKPKRQPIKIPTRLLKRIGIGLAAVGALAAVAIVLIRLDPFSGSGDSPAAPAVTDSTPAPARAKPKPIVLGDEAPAAPAPSTNTSDGANPQRAAPKPIILDDPEPAAPETDNQASSAPDAIGETPVAETVTAATGGAPAAQDIVQADAPPLARADTRRDPATPSRPSAAGGETEPPGEPLPIADKPDPPPDPVTTQPTTTAVASPSSPAPSAAPPTTTDSGDATATGGEVSRAVVASNVVDLEPVDDLGDSVMLDNGGYQTVFFFTELRNFTAGVIVHRWTHNGKVIANVPLRVGGGWRWRTYSSKDLLPGLTGDWAVAVVDGDGRVLGERRFQFDR